MNREDIIRMAREAGFIADEADFLFPPKNKRVGIQLEIERFAALVASAEREACADMVYRYISQTVNMEARGCLASVAYDIRARGQA